MIDVAAYLVLFPVQGGMWTGYSQLAGLRTSQYPCILFDGENISFDASLVIYIYIYY